MPVKRFDAVLSEFQEGIAKGDLYLPVLWFKKVHGESAWLSAADEDCVQCGIYHDVIEGTPSHVKETVTRVERIMLRHGGATPPWQADLHDAFGTEAAVPPLEPV